MPYFEPFPRKLASSSHLFKLLEHHSQWSVLHHKSHRMFVVSADGLHREIVIRIDERQILDEEQGNLKNSVLIR